MIFTRIIVAAFAFICCASATPIGVRSEVRLLKRADPFDGPVTVTTSKTFPDDAGIVTETCTITLTPVKGANGEDLVEEKKTCSRVVEPNTTTTTTSDESTKSDTSTSIDNGGTTSEIFTASATDTRPAEQTAATTTAPEASNTSVAPGPATVIGVSSVAKTDATATATSTATDAKNTSIAKGPATVIGVSSVEKTKLATDSATATATATDAQNTSVAKGPATVIGVSSVEKTKLDTATATASPTGTLAANTDAGPATVIGVSTVATSDLPTATQPSGTTPPITQPADEIAKAAAAEATQTFDVPGKKIEVLPIGLGVFAGIAVLALIVVGLVTYERTKYRKRFRNDKLAEAGALPGYGGMGQVGRP